LEPPRLAGTRLEFIRNCLENEIRKISEQGTYLIEPEKQIEQIPLPETETPYKVPKRIKIQGTTVLPEELLVKSEMDSGRERLSSAPQEYQIIAYCINLGNCRKR